MTNNTPQQSTLQQSARPSLPTPCQFSALLSPTPRLILSPFSPSLTLSLSPGMVFFAGLPFVSRCGLLCLALVAGSNLAEALMAGLLAVMLLLACCDWL